MFSQKSIPSNGAKLSETSFIYRQYYSLDVHLKYNYCPRNLNQLKISLFWWFHIYKFYVQLQHKLNFKNARSDSRLRCIKVSVTFSNWLILLCRFWCHSFEYGEKEIRENPEKKQISFNTVHDYKSERIEWLSKHESKVFF